MSRWALPRDTLALTATSAATTWLALTGWHGLVTYSSHYLGPAAALGAVLAVTGAVLDGRMSRRALFAVLLAITTLAFLWVARGTLDPMHGRSPYDAVRDAVVTFQTYRTPVYPSVPSATPLLFLGSAVALLVVQWLAAHARHAMTAGLALLAVLAVAGDTKPSLVAFVGTAAGFLAMLLLSSRRTPVAMAALRPAAPVGATAIAVAVVVAAVLPAPHSQLLPFLGSAGDQVTIHKPVVDLRLQLQLNNHQPLVEMQTNEPAPSYLRIAVLNRFTGIEWSSGDRNLSTNRSAHGDVPLSPGLSPDVPVRRYDVRVHALPAFSSSWLPTAYPISHIDAPGDWRWDGATMDFIGAGSTNTSDQTWTMTADRPDFGTDGRWFGDSRPHDVPDEVLAVPASVPTQVRDLAVRLTRDARSDYERALILQSYFHDGGRFRYSLDAAPPDPVGTAITDFLRERVGYCQQFAGTMALMARIVGVPARVAVGFLTPHRTGPDTWEYTSDDLHAWPELYFKGAGWVRFEPTPPSRTGAAPAYSVVPVQLPSDQGPGSRPDQQPSAGRSGGPRQQQPRSSKQIPEPLGGTTRAPRKRPDRVGRAVEVLAGVTGGAAVLGGGGIVTAVVVRRRRRARRLAGGPEGAWSELRATATDLGIPWPGDRSPRETGAALLPHLGGDDDAAGALAEVVGSVEELRYAPAARAVGVATRSDLGASAEVVIEALTANADRRQRRLARWLPRSLGRRS